MSSGNIGEGVLGNDGRIPIRTDGDEDQPGTGEFLQPLDVAPGVAWQIFDPPGPPNILGPAVQFLVNGPTPAEERQAGGNGLGELLRPGPIPGADLQLFDAGQDIQFRQGNAGDS